MPELAIPSTRWARLRASTTDGVRLLPRELPRPGRPRLLVGPVLRHVDTTRATVWVETDQPCTVEVLGHRATTFAVHGHHYAIATVEGLAPGGQYPYEVHLDGAAVWPDPNRSEAPSYIRTDLPGRPLRLLFGSCRHATPRSKGPRYDPDALDAYSDRLSKGHDGQPWPDRLMLLGDQVYADDPSHEIRVAIRQRRGRLTKPWREVADYEEYTWLYQESWRDPEIRWLLSTVPTLMLCDDHDVRDDWNTSARWRSDMARQRWWRSRIVGGLAAYWVYQHLGNLSPEDRAVDPIWQQVQECAAAGRDAGPVLDQFAAETDDLTGKAGQYRFSYRVDIDRTRVVFIDTRCGRVLDSNRRQMVDDESWDWIVKQTRGDVDHVILASSLPWLLPHAVHHLESWNAKMNEGSLQGLGTRFAEWFRRTVDMEHWASMRHSFEAMGDLVVDIASGRHGPPPATVCLLGGDVHHGYVAELRGLGHGHRESNIPRKESGVDVAGDDDVAPGEGGIRDLGSRPRHGQEPSRVYQLTCSPVHNRPPGIVRLVFSIGWSKRAARWVRSWDARLGHAPARFEWTKRAGPLFGNLLAELSIDGRRATTFFEQSRRVQRDRHRPGQLREVARLDLTGPVPAEDDG